MLGVVLVTVLSVVDADEHMDTLVLDYFDRCVENITSLFARRRKNCKLKDFSAAMLDWILLFKNTDGENGLDPLSITGCAIYFVRYEKTLSVYNKTSHSSGSK